jgi:uncharacterized OB-fold protein
LYKVCRKCGSTDIGTIKAKGQGKVVDFTVIYYAPDNYKAKAPYTSILVRLTNGCKLFGVIEGEAKGILPGDAVTLVKRDKDTGGFVFQSSKHRKPIRK